MKDSTVYDITLVQYPSVHTFYDGPNILLIGNGNASDNTDINWKDLVVEYVHQWDFPITITYIKPEDELVFDLEQLSWIALNSKWADYILCNVDSNDLKNLTTIAALCHKDNVHVIDNGNITSINMCKIMSLFNRNIHDNEITALEEIRKDWHKHND